MHLGHESFQICYLKENRCWHYYLAAKIPKSQNTLTISDDDNLYVSLRPVLQYFKNLAPKEFHYSVSSCMLYYLEFRHDECKILDGYTSLSSWCRDPEVAGKCSHISGKPHQLWECKQLVGVPQRYQSEACKIVSHSSPVRHVMISTDKAEQLYYQKGNVLFHWWCP